MTGPAAVAEALALLGARGWSLAVAESLTAGLVAARIAEVPGASAVFRGGVVAYATAVKRDLLRVDGAFLARVGAVHPEVALAMAEGAREAIGADVGLATTGVAGPDRQDGVAIGTVFVAVATPAGSVVRALALTGGRDRIRRESVDAVLSLCVAHVRER